MIPSAGRAPCSAQTSASIAPGGTRISAIHVRPSASCGKIAIPATTPAIETGRSSAQPRLLRRSSHGGMPAPVSATSSAWKASRKLLASMN